MRAKQVLRRNRPWAIAVSALMAIGALQVGLLLAGSPTSSVLGTSSAPSSSGTLATDASAAASPSASGSAASDAPTSAAAASPSAFGPHPGTIQAYEPVPGGATSEDPAVEYDTTSDEVDIEIYETLVNYNGSSTATYIPTLATCVPGQGNECATDYGAGFTGIFNAAGQNYTGSNGDPEYWTFVIDPAAHFYDPTTGASWHVYPTDVMFSVARTLAWSTYPTVSKTAGWILAQALLPAGNAAWDGGLHSPYNNTGSMVLGSMLINDSSYCPVTAMDGVHGNGCITFVADGSSSYWPDFLAFVADNQGASIVPCGWYTYESAGIPGWTGTAATKGDGSCALPDGGTATSNSAWTNYLASLSPKGWDAFIKLDANWPTPQPKVQWGMVGSGPYYGSVNPGLSYALAANPFFAQPSGCGGNPTDFPGQYTGYCDPAPGKYIPNVDVTWETAAEGDSLGTSAIEAGTADFAGIYTTQTTTLLGYVNSGLWQYVLFPTLSTGFSLIDLDVDYSAYNTSFAGTPLEANPIAPAMFSSIGLRNFYVAAYPYTTIQDTINTVDGVEFSFNAGGPIPFGMQSTLGNPPGIYPTNITWPYEFGNPTQSASVVGSAAWWWSQLTTPSSAYYDASLVKACTPSKPCTWPVGYFDGAPANLVLIDDWAAEVNKLSGGALSPWPLAEEFTTFLGTITSPYESPLVSSVGFGWGPDYPDPSDYTVPIAEPLGTYTSTDTFAQQLALPQYDDATLCGHSGNTSANLTYWANQAKDPANDTLTSACQGVAYGVASYWMNVANALGPSPQRTLDFNLIEHILNALGMYVWNGQANELFGMAPWIDPASINENPMIGGGGIALWFQVQYRSLYPITVSETGLPAGTSWSATISGPQAFQRTLSSTGTSIAFPGVANGTYNFSVTFQPGYAIAPSNGTITINGAAVTKSVTFTAVPLATTSHVTFNETGLVGNTSWRLVVAGYGGLSTNTTSLVFELPNATIYHYQAQFVPGYLLPAAGSVTVLAAPAYATVAYTGFWGATYALRFSEVGLPLGSSWSVTLGASTTVFPATSTPYTAALSLPNIDFYVPNGTFNYSVSTVPGYAATAAYGTVTVSGSTVTVLIEMGPTYSVTFVPYGLPTGTTWTVYFGGQTQSAAAPSSIVFTVTNDSWTFSVSASGYTASPSGGLILVFGSPQTQSVSFSSTKPAWTYLGTLAEELIAVLAVIAVAGFVLAAVLGRRKRPAAAPPATWTGGVPPEETTASSPSGPPPPAT